MHAPEWDRDILRGVEEAGAEAGQEEKAAEEGHDGFQITEFPPGEATPDMRKFQSRPIRRVLRAGRKGPHCRVAMAIAAFTMAACSGGLDSALPR